MKARDHVYDDLGKRDDVSNLEGMMIFNIFTPCIILASDASQKNYNNEIKQPLDPLSYPLNLHKNHIRQISGGGGSPVPIWICACEKCTGDGEVAACRTHYSYMYMYIEYL